MAEFERPDKDTALAFWLWPDWLGDNRDHPGDPGHVPFWMRPVKVPVAEVPARVAMVGDSAGAGWGSAPFRQALGDVLYYRGIRVVSKAWDIRTETMLLDLEGGDQVRVTLREMERW